MVQGKCKTSTNEKCFERRGRVSFRTAPVCFVILVNRRAMVDDAVRAMLQDDVIEPAASPFNAPLFLFPKSDDVPRAQVLRQAAQYGLWCQNYRTGVGTRAIFHTYLIGKFMMSPNYCREREPLLLLPFHGTFHPPMP
ncbi:uncharacterized protein LOC123518313 isoform X4 [Portunus trituberculatus]|uniref:uncharacterized protein LOC123518313 isoform X4 n=1 Tax=Portunus trituberculatus TaxID=210409 RepID=UPI001E1CBB8A|nr:uncharacterized protein LOC123518313 isoform X4 [Portunus trituberculatus]